MINKPTTKSNQQHYKLDSHPDESTDKLPISELTNQDKSKAHLYNSVYNQNSNNAFIENPFLSNDKNVN